MKTLKHLKLSTSKVVENPLNCEDMRKGVHEH